jgi:hypothetical protein
MIKHFVKRKSAMETVTDQPAIFPTCGMRWFDVEGFSTHLAGKIECSHDAVTSLIGERLAAIGVVAGLVIIANHVRLR